MEIINFLCGIILGAIIVIVYFKHNAAGTLRVDRSELDEPPRLFLEISRSDARRIEKSKYVILKVKKENFISHE